jgi:hypothetical protein
LGVFYELSQKPTEDLITNRKSTFSYSVFQHLYTADEGIYITYEGVNPTEILQAFEPRITDDVNAYLCKEFSDEEISDTIKGVQSSWIPTRFFQ